MLPEIFTSPFQDPIYSIVWNRSFSLAFWMLEHAVVFFLLVQILKRLPETKHNFKLAHTDRPFFSKDFGAELLWPLLTWIMLIPMYFLVDALGIWKYSLAYIPKHSFHHWIVSFPFWVQVIIGTLVLDFALYIRHRFVHHFAWSYHSIHHSAKEITWLTWLRLHPGDTFIMGLIGTVVLWILGFSAPSMLFAQVIMGHANRFNHSNIQLDWGFPFRYIFVSPNMHRWHHGTTDDAKNMNFCILWAWIDVVFGTFYVPAYELPKEYGAFDENGNDLMERSWSSQFLHPFKQHWKFLQSIGVRIFGQKKESQ